MQQSDIVHSQFSSKIDPSLSKSSDSTKHFSEFYRRYRGVVCTYLHSHRVPSHLVEDLAQEVFITAYQKRDCLHAKSAAFAWLAAITRYKVINYRRSFRRADRKIFAFAHEPKVTGDGERRPDRLVMQSLVRRYLSQLGQERLEVLVYSEVYGLSSVEISEFTKVNTNTIRARLAAARRRLRKLALNIDAQRVAEIEHSLLAMAAEESGGSSEKTESSLACLLPLLTAGSLSSVSCSVLDSAAMLEPAGLRDATGATESRFSATDGIDPPREPAEMLRSHLVANGQRREVDSGLDFTGQSVEASSAVSPSWASLGAPIVSNSGVHTVVGNSAGFIVNASIISANVVESSMKWIFMSWKGWLGTGAMIVTSMALLGGGDFGWKTFLEPEAAIQQEKSDHEATLAVETNSLQDVMQDGLDKENRSAMEHNVSMPSAIAIEKKRKQKSRKSDRVRENIRTRKFEQKDRQKSTLSTKIDSDIMTEVSPAFTSKESARNKKTPREKPHKNKPKLVDPFSRELFLLGQAEICKTQPKAHGRAHRCRKLLETYDREFANRGQLLSIRRALGNRRAR